MGHISREVDVGTRRRRCGSVRRLFTTYGLLPGREAGTLSLEMYRQALIDFDSAGSSAVAQRGIVLEVGQEALRETGDWLVMNTSQSVRPV